MARLKIFVAQNRQPLSALVCVAAGSLCAKCFVINPELYVGLSAVPAAVTDYIWLFMALALAWLFNAVYFQKRLRPHVGECLFGLLFGVLNYFCTTLFAYDSWLFIGVSVSYAAVALKCLGQAAAMTTLLTGAAAFLQRGGLKAPERVPAAGLFPRLRAFYREHTTLAVALLCLIGWLPYLIAFYPGTVISDAAWMFEQYAGITQMTTWHSVFTTWVLGACVSLGRLLNSDNLGCCLYMLLQTLLLAYAFGRTLRLLRRLRVKRVWQLGVMAFFALLPIWGSYAQMIGKDTFYTASLLILFLQVMELTLLPEGGRYAAADWLRLFLSALLCCLWRNNGVYVVAPTAIAAVALLARGRKRLPVAGAFGLALALFLAFDQALIPSLNIVNASSSGLYSICFQQTARTVRDSRADLTEAEKAEIDKVLDLERIGMLYEPWISDPVKDTYRYFGAGVEAEKAALAEYRQTWLSMLKRFPKDYIMAFLGNNSGYYAFTPKYDGVTYSQQAGARFYFTNFWLEGEGELRTRQPEGLEGLRKLMASLAQRVWTLPVFSVFYCCAAYTWLLIAAAIALAHQKRWRAMGLMIPILFSFAVCLLSPVNDYIRYFLPVIACGVPMTAFVGAGKG